jgi:predicted house-cleaning NTP pyrophosphatase (Maf/HAM1 superfamily)
VTFCGKWYARWLRVAPESVECLQSCGHPLTSSDTNPLLAQGLKFYRTISDYAEDLDKSQYTPREYVIETGRRKVLSVALQQRASSPPSTAATSCDTSASTSTATTSSLAATSATCSPPATTPAELIIGADTVVVRDEHILEKPRSVAEARVMLRSLAGRTHVVMTGVTLWVRGLSVAALSTASAPTSPSPLSEIHAAVGLSAEALRVTECGEQAAVVFSFCEETEVRFAELDDREVAAYCATSEPYDKAGGYGYQGVAGCLVSEIRGCYFNVVGFPLNRFARLLSTLVRLRLIQ